jgi:ribosomal protein S18 acetylase RimI-like enzyme
MAEWVIEGLNPTHERAQFSSGQPLLDTFLRTLVSQYEKRRLGRTFVATRAGQVRVAGYYTLAAGSFDVSCLAPAARKRLPKHPVPTIHLGRLAVDQAFHGQRLGETLLFHALAAGLALSEKLGAFAVDVWAVDEKAQAFYMKYGFLPRDDNPLRLYLPMKTVEAMFDEPGA